MRFTDLSVAALAAYGAIAAELKIDVTQGVECERKTKKGDTVDMHYRGTLQSTGEKFDASYDRNEVFSFTLGAGQVIAGWDEGLIDMCIGEKRTLTIPPEKGYGERAIGPIPPSSTLVFETELIGIQGVEKPKEIKFKEKVEEAAGKASEGVAHKVAEKFKEAGEILETVVGGDDGQEHNEL